MTEIINGYAQPDIVATKGRTKIAIFVETPHSLKANVKALTKSFLWYKNNEPNTRVDLVHTVSRGGK